MDSYYLISLITDSNEKRTTAKGKLRLILLLLALYYSTSELLKDSHFSEANMYAHPPQEQYVVSTLGPRPMVCSCRDERIMTKGSTVLERYSLN